jgi:hypothetical protein
MPQCKKCGGEVSPMGICTECFDKGQDPMMSSPDTPPTVVPPQLRQGVPTMSPAMPPSNNSSPEREFIVFLEGFLEACKMGEVPVDPDKILEKMKEKKIIGVY